jgi:hypothetical protein
METFPFIEPGTGFPGRTLGHQFHRAVFDGRCGFPAGEAESPGKREEYINRSVKKMWDKAN